MNGIQLISKSGLVTADLGNISTVNLTDPSQIVKVTIAREMISGTQKVGNNLEIVKTDGSSITINNFFAKSSSGDQPKLVIDDSSSGQLYKASYDADSFSGMSFNHIQSINDATTTEAAGSDINPAVWIVPLVVAAGAGIGVIAYNSHDGGGHHHYNAPPAAEQPGNGGNELPDPGNGGNNPGNGGNEGNNPGNGGNEGNNPGNGGNEGNNPGNSDEMAKLLESGAKTLNEKVTGLGALIADHQAATQALDLGAADTVAAANAAHQALADGQTDLGKELKIFDQLIANAKAAGVDVEAAQSASDQAHQSMTDGQTTLEGTQDMLDLAQQIVTDSAALNGLQEDLQTQLNEAKTLVEKAIADPVSNDGANLAQAQQAVAALADAYKGYQGQAEALQNLVGQPQVSQLPGADALQSSIAGALESSQNQVNGINDGLAEAAANQDSFNQLSDIVSQMQELNISDKGNLEKTYQELLTQKGDFLSGKNAITDYNQNLITSFNQHLEQYNSQVTSFNEQYAQYLDLATQAQQIIDNGFSPNFDSSLLPKVDLPAGEAQELPVFDTELAVNASGTTVLGQLTDIVKSCVDWIGKGILDNGYQNIKAFFSDLHIFDTIGNLIPEIINGVTDPIGFLKTEVGVAIKDFGDFFFKGIPDLVSGCYNLVKTIIDIPSALFETLKTMVTDPASIGELLHTAAGYVVNGVAEFFKELGPALKDIVSNTLKNNPSDDLAIIKVIGDDAMNAASGQIKHAFESLYPDQSHTALDKFLSDLSTTVHDKLDGLQNVLKFFHVFDTVNAAIEHFAPTVHENVIGNALDKIGAFIDENLTMLGDKIAKVADLMDTGFKFDVTESPITAHTETGKPQASDADATVKALLSSGSPEINLDSLVAKAAPQDAVKAADTAIKGAAAPVDASYAVANQDLHPVNDDHYALTMAV